MLECGVSGCYLYMFFILECLILAPWNVASSFENRKTHRKRIFRPSVTKVRSHYASQVVDLLNSFPKSGRTPKTELRVKSCGYFKFRLKFCVLLQCGQATRTGWTVCPHCARTFLCDQSASASISVHPHRFWWIAYYTFLKLARVKKFI